MYHESVEYRLICLALSLSRAVARNGCLSNSSALSNDLFFGVFFIMYNIHK